MPSADPKVRAKVNALYYQRKQATDPDHKRRRERAWRAKNRDKINSSAREYYERNAERVRFKVWLLKQLMKIRRAEIARGRVPFDG